jgi:guanylate kinase
MNVLITLTGPSCAGKTTLEEALIKRGAARVISNTSREPRPGEVDGRDYHFRNRSWFEEKLSRGELVEHVEFSGNFYGNTQDDILDALARGGGFAVWVIEPTGLKQVKKWHRTTETRPLPQLYSVFVDGDPNVLMERFMTRTMPEGTFVTAGKVKAAARRLAQMATTERMWQAEAVLDISTLWQLYDLYVERYDEQNAGAVGDWLEGVAKSRTVRGTVNDGMFWKR